MQTVVIAIGLTMLAMLALGIGLAFRRPPLRRSCGGVACLETCNGCDRLGGNQAP
jgi:hypothetical protein